MHTFEHGGFCLFQIQVREKLPYGDRQIANQRLLNLAEPSHELCEPYSWQAIGQQEIKIFLRQNFLNQLAKAHNLKSCKLVVEKGIFL
jgi:hypothetical protein